MFPVRSLLRTLPHLRRHFTTSAPRAGGDGVWTYRAAPAPPARKVVLKAEILGAVMWWWILYHLFTEPEHLTGEFPYPDPSSWSDAELGIPPDNED